MRKLQITLFLIAFSILTFQCVRDVYVKWFETHTSVLDKYRKKTEADLASSKDLNQLLVLYDAAHKRVEVYETTHPPANDPSAEYGREQTEPYKSEASIKAAIKAWEDNARERRQVIFYWCCGVVSLIVGIILYRYLKNW